jgi:hypothetical protein
MFDRRKCRKCRHRAHFTGDAESQIYCNFCRTGKTNLKAINGEVVDTRGNDPKHCKHYEEGNYARYGGEDRE